MRRFGFGFAVVTGLRTGVAAASVVSPALSALQFLKSLQQILSEGFRTEIPSSSQGRLASHAMVDCACKLDANQPSHEAWKAMENRNET